MVAYGLVAWVTEPRVVAAVRPACELLPLLRCCSKPSSCRCSASRPLPFSSAQLLEQPAPAAAASVASPLV